MRGPERYLALGTVLLALGLASCGSDGDSGSTAGSQPQGGDGTAAVDPQPGGEGAAAEFRVKGGDNSIQEFGAEASGSELDEAAAALNGFLDARVAGEWSKACSHLTKATAASFQQLAFGSEELAGKGCGPVLQALSEGVPKATLEEAAEAEAGALRIDGDRSFLLYHGAGGTDYAIPMGREDDDWKVGALAGTPLN
jgi:hypothetical protein